MEEWAGEICNRTTNGQLYWLKTTIVPVLILQGKPYQYITIRRCSTEQKEMEIMKYMAYHDELTGLPNRRMLNLRLDAERKRRKQTETKMAVIFMDINHFKKVKCNCFWSFGWTYF